MQIHQFAAAYQPEEDRILLRANSAEGEEVALWLTRRLMDRLWPRLQALSTEALLRHDVQAAVAEAPTPLRQMLADYRKAELLAGADFSTPYQAVRHGAPEAAEPRRLWPRPLLVTQVELQAEAQGALQLRFSENFGHTTEMASFQMHLDRLAAQGVLHLLEQALRESQWIAAIGGPAAAAPGLVTEAAAGLSFAAPHALGDEVDGEGAEALVPPVPSRYLN